MVFQTDPSYRNDVGMSGEDYIKTYDGFGDLRCLGREFMEASELI